MICSFCGKTIRKSPAEVKKNKHSFCNRECFFKYQKEMQMHSKIQTNCLCCGEEIYHRPSLLKNFCNRRCFHEYLRTKQVHPNKKHSFLNRLIRRIGGASNENKENQKVPRKETQRQIIDSKTTNPTIENLWKILVLKRRKNENCNLCSGINTKSINRKLTINHWRLL